MSFTPAVQDDRAVDRCPVCQGADFYVRKDFAPKVGLTIIIIGASISAVFYWFGRDVAAYGCSAAAQDSPYGHQDPRCATAATQFRAATHGARLRSHTADA